MSREDRIREEVIALYNEGAELTKALQDGESASFHYDYQSWYTKALPVVARIAPDRCEEFKAYYNVDPRRKALTYSTYVIQDYLRGVVPSSHTHPDFDTRNQALMCLFNQITIFKSLIDRVESAVSDIEGELLSSIQDDELLVAQQLLKISPRAAGSLAGVIIEGHLQHLWKNHGIRSRKKRPTISDLSEPLKAAGVLDKAEWRKIAYLADLRNLCTHKKDSEPTKDQVDELIQGAQWLVKNVG